MILEYACKLPHTWTGKTSLEDSIVDAIAKPDNLLNVALKLASKVAPKAKMEVYALLRDELWG